MLWYRDSRQDRYAVASDGSAPLADVESIEAKRLLVGKTVTVTVRGVSVKLEVGAGGDARGLSEFARARGTD